MIFFVFPLTEVVDMLKKLRLNMFRLFLKRYDDAFMRHQSDASERDNLKYCVDFAQKRCFRVSNVVFVYPALFFIFRRCFAI